MLKSSFDTWSPQGEIVRDYVGRGGVQHHVEWCGKRLVWKVSNHVSLPHRRKKRNKISHFSRASRFRMLCMVATINWYKCLPGSFLTLSFDEESDDMNSQRTNQARHVFWRHLERYAGRQLAGIWRVEWLPRQSGRRVGVWVPHVHIMAFRTPFVHWTKIRSWWQDALQVSKANTKVNCLYTPKQAGCYIAKYCGKVEECGPLGYSSYLNTVNGRHWGVFRPSLLPKCKTHEFALPPGELLDYAYETALHSLPFSLDAACGSFTLLGDAAERVGRILLSSSLTTPPTHR